MTVLLGSTVGSAEKWIEPIKKELPDEVLRNDLESSDLNDVDILLLGHKVSGIYQKLPNLQLIIGLQAGVDTILNDPELPFHVPIVRACRPNGDQMITEYVLMNVMFHHRNMPFFLKNQRLHIWKKPNVLEAGERSVGFMGFGLIAKPCGMMVSKAGFQVACWTRNPKQVEGIKNFFGNSGLRPFLEQTDILVNILPLTPDTENLLNLETFGMLPEGAKFINIGRGQHVVDKDLVTALDSGQLDGATLDVYREEPLPKDHPFWDHPKITLMPHTARKTRPKEIIPQVSENIRRFRSGKPLLQIVDRLNKY
ncbi:MAG: glyoxylate/hydroxypyruvate reductase A [Pseudomonadota bacterium]|nr:glyoxylate/hydroxypyruvate reductase A [Pseudomonadota bacterium]